MVAELTKGKTLYDTDYNLWVLDMAAKLKRQEFSALDLENLIEEIEDLGRRDKRKLESLLMKLIEHLLILQYWQAEKYKNRGHWEREIFNYRKQINRLLADSPSLNNYLNNKFHSCYLDGKKMASKHSQLPLNTFPEAPITTLEDLLDEDWLPE
ncbi:DUF29 domain-containing protein [Synechocystis salina]|uniref:DUF29 domain-containing protein n=1 Tax=Synechocystis salina LEGE 00031 TaxID=1828736 RepID=A0ABR9VT70_9SYNC|nr:DUF29 domain-containing protein [Synechocystis salina]MBE9241099.1 DUF29 domain-containing protein [Synechocystis salina LEGE 00041]MBE9254549.1 DUF29 domain-containing protein [Synechocystis salina LEGE 00031]